MTRGFAALALALLATAGPASASNGPVTLPPGSEIGRAVVAPSPGRGCIALPAGHELGVAAKVCARRLPAPVPASARR